MMHDAIRGDVQGALIAVDIRSIRALALPTGIQTSLAEVETEFREYKVSAASGSQSKGVAQVAGLVNNMKTVDRCSATTMELTARAADRSRSESERLDQAAHRLLALSAAY